MDLLEHNHSVIDALAVGRHWRFWLKGWGGGGWKILVIKAKEGYVNFQMKL